MSSDNFFKNPLFKPQQEASQEAPNPTIRTYSTVWKYFTPQYFPTQVQQVLQSEDQEFQPYNKIQDTIHKQFNNPRNKEPKELLQYQEYMEAKRLYFRHQLPEALKKYQIVLNKLKKKYKRSSALTFAKVKVAELLSAYAKLKEAKELGEEALKELEELGALESLTAADCYDVLGCTYLDEVKYEESSEFFKKAFRLRKKILKKPSIEMVRCYASQSFSYEYQENFDEAVNCLKLAIEQAKLSEEDLDEDFCFIACFTYIQLCSIYEKTEKYNLILETIEELKTFMKEKNYQSDVVDISIYTKEGGTYAGLEQYDKCIEATLKGLELCRKVNGEVCEQFALLAHQLGDAYLQEGSADAEKAKLYYDKALSAYEKLHGKDYFGVNGILISKAYAVISEGDFKGGQELARRALNNSIAILGKDHPTTQDIQQNVEMIQQMTTGM